MRFRHYFIAQLATAALVCEGGWTVMIAGNTNNLWLWLYGVLLMSNGICLGMIVAGVNIDYSSE